MILRDGEIGVEYRVKDIQLEEKIRRRLQVLGLTQGAGVEILNRKKSGTTIIQIRGTRFAVGKQIVEGIQVQEPEEAAKADAKKEGQR